MSRLNTLVRDTHDYASQANLLGLALAGPASTRMPGHAVICQDFSMATMRAVARRRLWPGAPLLLRVNQMPDPLRRSHRAILAAVDVVLATSPGIAEALRLAGVPMARIVVLPRSDDADEDNDLGMFAAALRLPIETQVRRLVHVGDLEPEAGVADFLACAQSWAQRHPERRLEIAWAGDGCLRGVLRAQPLPANLTQRFLGVLDREQLAALLLEGDMLAAPALSEPSGASGPSSGAILEAMTAGLPVLGSLRLAAVRERVTPGDTGFLFDPLLPRDMARALELALDIGPEELEETRARAVARFNSAPVGGLEERIQRALQLAPRRAGMPLVSRALAR